MSISDHELMLDNFLITSSLYNMNYNMDSQVYLLCLFMLGYKICYDPFVVIYVSEYVSSFCCNSFFKFYFKFCSDFIVKNMSANRQFYNINHIMGTWIRGLSTILLFLLTMISGISSANYRSTTSSTPANGKCISSAITNCFNLLRK